MRFADDDDGVYLTLLPGDPVTFEAAGETWQTSVPRSRLLALADWYKDLWEVGAVFDLEEARVVFTLTHREHVGEGYVEIRHKGKILGVVYEQLGLSNTHRANTLRSEISSHMPT